MGIVTDPRGKKQNEIGNEIRVRAHLVISHAFDASSYSTRKGRTIPALHLPTSPNTTTN